MPRLPFVAPARVTVPEIDPVGVRFKSAAAIDLPAMTVTEVVTAF
jgi:hypothetical protein